MSWLKSKPSPGPTPKAKQATQSTSSTINGVTVFSLSKLTKQFFKFWHHGPRS